MINDASPRTADRAALSGATTLVEELNERSRLLFRQIVETYLESGEPVGSRLLAQRSPLALSAATIRNVMSDLEQMGLLFAPHTSAGRIPTQLGLRLFVDGLLEVGDLSEPEREEIEGRLRTGQHLEDVVTRATAMLSGLSHCAGLVVAPKSESALKHVEFVAIAPGKALVVMVTEGGTVENRIIEVPHGMLPSTLVEATNFLNARVRGRTLDEAAVEIMSELEAARSELDALAAKVVAQGLAVWSGARGANTETRDPQLIVRGQAHLLENVSAAEDIERIRMLFDDLESKKDMIQLLDLAKAGAGVRIFIGAENKLFSLSGSSLIVAPYTNARNTIVGVLGVIGPTRLNYARVIPMVDYTARVVSRIIK